MSSWRRLRRRIQRALYLPAQADREMDDEIRFHLAEETRLQSERGLPAAEAATAARRAFGSIALAKENTRAVWVSTTLEQLVQDLRIGCRILTKAPAVSATAVILIALVIGGNTTVFSIAHGIITKPAPGVHATGLTTLSWVAENGDIETHAGHPVFAHFQEQSTALQIAAVDFQRVTLTHDNGSYAARAGIVSPNYFDTLGVRLVKGRSFTRGRSGARHVGPRRRHRSSCVAELLWRDPQHRRAGCGCQRPAGDCRRRRRSGVSRRLAGGDGRPLGAAGR